MSTEEIAKTAAAEALRDQVLRRRLRGAAPRRSPGIGRADRSSPLALSYGQQQMWFLSRLEPDSAEFLVPLAFRLRGRLDPAALEQALTKLVARHEILRTRYALLGTEPVQVVDAPAPLALPVRRVAGDALDELVARESALPFDLERQWPVRAGLLRLAEDDHVLTVTFHHIAFDAWSTGVFGAELSTLYADSAAGRPASLPPLPVQYADYAAWQRREMSGDTLDRHLAYWRRQLADLEPVDLPGDRTRPPVRGHTGAAVPFTLPDQVARRIRWLAARRGATVFSVLLAAFQVLVARYTGRSDVAVGTVVSGRTRPELQGLIGYGINNLVMRGRWTSDPTFGELVTQARDCLIDAYDHQAVPFARLVDELQPERDLSRTPLYQVGFTMHERDGEALELAGLRVLPHPLTGQVAKCDLELQADEARVGSLAGQLVYATALFDHDTVARMARHLVRLLESAVTDDSTPVSRLELLDEAERAMVTVMPAGGAPEPVARCVHEVFEQQVARRPDAVAVVADGIELSYVEVNERANRLAHHLRGLGVGAESLVGVCLERGVELIPALLGVLKAGAGYVPLDPVNPVGRLEFVMADAGVSAVLTTADLMSLVDGVFPGPIVVLDELVGGPVSNPAPVSGPDNVIYVIYTSGSTGRPKGCVLTHRNVLRLLWTAGEHHAFGDTDVWSMTHSFAFDVSVFEMWGALLSGGRLVVVPWEVTRSGEALLDLLADHRVTVLSQTPSAFRALASLAGDERTGSLALRAVIFAGERLELSELRPWVDRLGLDRPALVNMYGITETTVHTTYHRVTAGDLDQPFAHNPIGHPLSDLRMYLMDEAGNPAPIGVPGEIHVGGPGVARGYLNRPALTAERFVPDPFGTPGERLYRSGDLARRRADGSLEFLGRIDHQVKIRGYRVELGEIEVVLSAHPEVREAVVVVRADASGGNRLVAYVVPAGEEVPGAAELRGHLGHTLPEYMVPAAFVSLPSIPLTVNGKLDTRALPAPDGDAFARGEYVAPRSPLEQRVAAVWAQLLELDRVGVHDNFFDLGGDSIRAVALVGALRAEGLDLTVRDLFDRRSVAEVCELLAGRSALAAEDRLVRPLELISAEDRAALPDGVVDAYPLSQIQLGMVIELLADDSQNNYHNVSSFRIRDDRPFSFPAFRRAAEILVARHEVLRTSLHLNDFSVPLQLVRAAAEVGVGMADLRGLDPGGVDAALHDFVAAERGRPFELSVPSLVRFFAHVTEDDAWWISVTECHPILEGWSHHSLLMELLDCYRQLRDGAEPAAAELPRVRFADAIAGELASLESAADRAFWRELVTTREKFVLPSGWGDGSGGPRVTHQVRIAWDDLEPGLRALAATARVSLKSVLISAYLKVLSQLTDAPRFHAGLVYDTRPEVLGADRVYGMYLNTLPFGFDRSARTWLDLVRTVFAGEVDSWSHRRFPLPAIQRDLGGSQRLIEVFFNYQDFRQVDAELVDGQVGIDDSPTEFPLTISSRNKHVFFTADSRMLSRVNVERIAAMFRAVLESMAGDPLGDARPVRLPSGEAERLADWATGPDAVVTPPVLELVERQAARTPDAVAVVCGEHRLSYRELDQRANRLAHHLRSLGVGPESVVGVRLDRGTDLLAGLLAVWKAGGAYLPLDPALPAQRVERVLSDAGVGVVLTQSAHVAGVPIGRAVLMDRDIDAIEAWPSSPVGVPGDLNRLAYVIYTSGSTGQPKGVLVSHRGLANHLQWAVSTLAARSTGGAPVFSSVAFDLVVPNLWAPLVAGQPVHLIPQDVDLSAVGQHLTGAGPFSFVKLTPGQLEVLTHQLSAEQAAALAAVVVVAGEAMTGRVVRAWRAMAPSVELINEYGPTEASVGTCVHPVPNPLPGEVVPIGRPLPGMTMHVLDESLRRVPIGVAGELYVGGAGVARGYLGQPGPTAERFLPDPFGSPGGRMYRTGDVVRVLPDGAVEFLGRGDGQVKIRGYRVELGEIEAVLAEQPGVMDVRVVSRESVGLVAYLVGATIDPTRLRDRLARTLPDYMLPSAFLPIDAIPLTANGKLDVRALPAPDAEALAVRDHVIPRTPVEERIAAVWREVLSVDRVGVLDDFFELGGDSIRAVALVGALRAENLDLTVGDVLRYRTVAAVCELLAGRSRLRGDERIAVAPFELISEADREMLPPGVVDAYPLSQNQIGMLVEMLADEVRNNYHNVNVYRVRDEEPFAAEAFRRAVETVVARHDVLRTSVHLTGFSMPMQLVHAEVPVVCTVRDLRDRDDRQVRRDMTDFVAAERAAVFDLTASDSLLRVHAHLLPDGQGWLCSFTQSHAIMDGWSNQLLLLELVGCYRRLRDGAQPEPYPAPAVRFADSIAAERRSLDSEVDIEYWRNLVAGHAKFTLPADWHGDLAAAPEVVRAGVVFHDLTDGLRALAGAARTSLKSVLVAAYLKVLGQLTNEESFHAGLVTHTRVEASGADRVHGTYLNTLPFPADRSARTWRELVRQVSEREIEAWPHRFFPMPAIAQRTGQGRLVDVFFGYLDFHGLDGESVDDGWAFNDAPNEFALGFTALDGILSLRSHSHVLSQHNADRIGSMFRSVLEAMAADPDGDARAVHLPAGERAQLLASTTDDEHAFVSRCAHEEFEQRVARTPDAVALVAGAVELTYRELNERANRLAHHLRGLGVGVETLVGVCLDRDAELVPALLGVLKAGAGYVPLDPVSPLDRLGFVVADAGVSIVVTSSDLLSLVDGVGASSAVVLDELTDGPVANPEPVSDPDNVIYVIYTSGSTGRPKGCVLTHRNVLELMEQGRWVYGFDESDVWPLFHSYAFDFSVWEMWGALLFGGRLVVVPREVSRSPEDVLDLLVGHRVTVLNQTPSAFRSLAAVVAQDPTRAQRLVLRKVILGGEALHISQLRPWADRLGLHRPALVNMYGITETTVVTTFHQLSADDLDTRSVSPVGVPMPGQTAHLLDRSGNLVPQGVAGEIHVGGSGVARGYLARPELTAERFVPNPFGPPGSRLYRSGDLARRLPDGSLEFLGRMDQQVKLHGYRIELGEIEAVLASHPRVRQAAVVVREDSLVAYCVGDVPAGVELAAHCGTRLPAYMVPSAFVALESIPLTANGKLDIGGLPAPDGQSLATADYIAPRTPLEERVCAVWCDVLGVERAGVHDGFFDLGGDSIRAVALVGALRAENLDISVRDVFDRPTIAGLGELLSGRGTLTTDGQRAIAPFELISQQDRDRLPGGVVDAYPLSQVQTGMLVEMLADDGRNRYHGTASYLVRDERPFSESTLHQAIGVLCGRQDILRTSFDLTSYSVPMQLVHATVDVPLDVRDLTGIADETKHRMLRDFVLAERANVFDMTIAPLVRVVVHTDDAGWRLSLTHSHALVEGWSLHSMMMELVGCYRRLREGVEPEPFEPPAVRFADAIAAELRSLESTSDREYWRTVVEENPPLAVPVGWGDADGNTDYTVHVPVHDLADRLRALAARAKVAPKSVLLAAYAKVMSQLTEKRTFHTGLVCHVRPEVLGADRVYGMYLNTVPFQVDRSARTWQELVRQVFDREARLWPHRRFPLPEMQRMASSGRLIDVLFSYLDFQALDDRLVDTRTDFGEGATEFALAVIASLSTGIKIKTNTRTLSQANVERIAAMLRLVLEAMAADPDGDARTVYLPPGERELLLAEGTAAAAREPVSRCVPEVFEEQVARTPDAVAVVADGAELSYAELNEQANRLAHHLRGLGVGAESLVGVCLERGAELIPALLGVIKSGAGYVPLDPVHPADRLGYVLADAGVSVVVTTSDLLSVVDDVTDVPVVVLDELTGGPVSNPVLVTEPDNVLYVIYTSGSTGRPKGCVLTHRNVLRLVPAIAQRYRFDESDVVALFHSVAFDVSVLEMWSTLLSGARLVVVPTAVTRAPDQLLDLLVDNNVTALMQTPSALRLLVGMAEAGDPRVELLSLRLLLVGGEMLEAAALRPWVDRLGRRGPMLVNCHGITEASVVDTWQTVEDRHLAEGTVIPIGTRLGGDLSVHLLDESGDLVPAGVPGEIYIGGPGIARGYADRPLLTAERFVPDPFGEPGLRLYRTGDYARRRRDGSLEFVGRIDGQVKVRGHRVELGEIQAALTTHERVREAVVMVLEDRLVAYCVAAYDTLPPGAELAEHCGRVLPAYMVPSAFVALDAIPLTTNGKLDHRALPAPDGDVVARAAYTPPSTPEQQRVAAVWTEVLGVERIGVHDDFFSVGGDSIRGVALVGALRGAGLDVSVRDVLEHRTIAGLCAALAGRPELSTDVPGHVLPFALIPAPDRAMVPTGVVDAYPLSQNQTGMLVEMLTGAGGTSYHNVSSVLVRDEQPFSADALRTAVATLVARHEVLRTVVDLTSFSVPMQLVLAEAEIPCDWSDLRHLDEPAQRHEITAFVERERTEVFDLTAAEPLFRVFAHVRDDDQWLCTITQSHAILEGWSYHLLLDELTDCYWRIRAGHQPSLPESPSVRFADAIAAELASLESEVDRAYWDRVVAEHARFTLPAAWADAPDESDASGSAYGLRIPLDEVRDGLRTLADEAGVPWKTVLLAAHLKVLSQLTDEQSFHSGLVCHSRPEAPGAERVYGMYLNTLPFPFDRSARSWRELARRVFDRETELWQHRFFPMPEIQRRAGGRLIEVIFNYVDFRHDDGAADVVLSTAPTEFALTVNAHGDDHISLRASTSTVSRVNAERVAGMFRQVLAAMAADVDGDARTVYLPPGERERLLVDGAADHAEPVSRCVHELFEQQVARTPDAVAVVADGERLTYAELNARANRVAHHLRDLGVEADSLVGLCLGRGMELTPALLGVLKAGAGYLPMDLANPADRLGYLLADSDSSVVLTVSAHVPLLDGVFDGHLVVLDDDADLARCPDTNPEPVAGPDNLIYGMYTSGSTGRPKGVCLSHANVVRLMAAADEHFSFDESDVWAQVHSFGFDVSVFEIWGALLHGGRLVVIPQAVTRSPDELLDLLVEHEVTMLCHTPTAFRVLVAAAGSGDPRIGELCLRTVVLGGEKLDVATLEPWVARLGLGRIALVNGYGPTEVTVYSTYHRIGKRDLEPEGSSLIGRPLADLQAYLLDPAGNLVPAGVPGELYIGGARLARGYLNRPRLTAERFVPNPYGSPGSRLYRTGDLVRRRPDGSLDFIGRADDQVKIRGYRIEPGEIEVALGAHPAVREAAVIARETAARDKQLVAYVVPNGHDGVDAGQLRAFLTRTLPDYMIPVAFVAIDRIPQTTNGKLDRRALPAPDHDALAQTAYLAPRTPLEQRVAAVWAKVLGVDRIGQQDSFFALGGDSIRAVALVGELRAEGLDVAMRDVFERPALAELCAALAGRSSVDGPPSVAPFALLPDEDRARVPAGIVDAYPLTQNQIGMLVEMFAAAGPRRYHLVNSVRFRDGRPFSADALRRAVDDMVARHEVLRTSVDLETFSVPVQMIHAEVDVPVDVVHLDALDERQRIRALRDFVRLESEAVFAHDEAPLLRITVHTYPDGSWQCTVTQSHLITDGWSFDVLLRQLLEAYHRYRDGAAPAANEPPAVRFADAVAAETRAIASDEDRAFWRELVTTREKFVLPAGWGGGADTVPDSVNLRVRIDDLDEALRGLADAAKVSLKTVLLAAFLKVLSQLTPEQSFFAGLTTHVRPEARGSDRVYGMHLNTLPFPYDRTARTWLDLVREVFANEAAMWSHRHFPMPEIQREWADGQQRLVDVYFSFQDFDAADTDLADPGASMGHAANEFALSVATAGGRLYVRTNARVVSLANARRVARMLRLVLVAMAAGADGDARAVYLPAGEAALLTGWARRLAELCSRSVPELFDAQVARTPDAIALAVGGETRLSYVDLQRRANRFAHHLRSLDVGPDSVVGVLLDHDVELIVCLLGVWQAGGAYLPLDPAFPAERVRSALDECAVEVVVTSSGLADQVAGAGRRVVSVDEDAEVIAAASSAPPGVAGDLDRSAYVIYTSGSTGRPKGVSVPHRGVANHVRWAAAELASRGTGGAPVFSSVAFDLVVPNLWAPLVAGQTVHLVPRELQGLGQRLAQSAPYSFVKLTPGQLELLTHQLSAEQAAGLARVVVVAGEALTARVVAGWRALAPSVDLVNEYGPTEASVGTCVYPIPDTVPGEVVPIGRPLPGMTMRVLDESLEQVPLGVAGELYVGGTGVVRGYVGRPGLTAERFLPDPFGGPGSRLYRTGDLARVLPSGDVEFLGRRDRQVKIRGYRVELGEIEAALAEQPSVTDARVVLHEDAVGDQRLVAYVVGDQLEPTRLRDELGRILPDFMLPSAFRTVNRLPLTPNGKVDERTLSTLDVVPVTAGAYAAPRTPTEALLATVWADALGVPRVGARDDFFDLGGHSITVIKLVSQARKAGLPLTLFMVYQHPILEEQAAAIDAAQPAPAIGPATAAIPTPLRAMADAGVPGVSVAVISGGELVAAEGFGVLTAGGPDPVTPDTVFQAGSLSKHVTALGVIRLVDQGVLDLDADVNRYLTAWRVPGGRDAAPITLRQLLGHRSGLAPNEGKGYRPDSVPSLLDVLYGRLPAINPPVTRELPPDSAFRKANVHFSVVQQVMVDATGQEFPDLMRELVLDPLGMHGSDFDQSFPHRSGRPVAAGHHTDGTPVDGGWLVRPDLAAAGLWATAVDLAALAQEIRRCHLGRPRALCSRELVRQLLTPDPESRYGLGTVVDDSGPDPRFGHGGEPVGYHALSTCGLHSGSGWVVLTNGAGGHEVVRMLASAMTF